MKAVGKRLPLIFRAHKCRGCGYCCVDGPCIVAVLFHGIPDTWGHCPSLLWDGTRHWCGLYRWRKVFRWFGWVRDTDDCLAPFKCYPEDEVVDRTIDREPPRENFKELFIDAWVDATEIAEPYRGLIKELFKSSIEKKE